MGGYLGLPVMANFSLGMAPILEKIGWPRPD